MKAKDVPPPSTTIPSQKPKVDFRPAPKVLKPETRCGTSQSPRPAKPTIQEGSAASSSTSSSTSAGSTTPGSAASESLLQTTQADILDATKRGVLSAPPEDASKLGIFWHNIKQLFFFYSRGIKLIFVTHRKEAGAIRRRIQEARARGEVAAMSRMETRFVKRYRMDLVKSGPCV